MIHHIRDPKMLGAALVAGIAMLFLALAFIWRAHDQEKFRMLAQSNCEQIEALKVVIRPKPFNLAETIEIAKALNIDPTSEQAQKLIERARLENVRERRELAPKDC